MKPAALLEAALLAAFGIAWQWWPRREPGPSYRWTMLDPMPTTSNPIGVTRTPFFVRGPSLDSLRERGAL